MIDSEGASTNQRAKKSSLAVNLGLFANILLAILKITFGVTAHSPALLADGVNSTSDVAYYIVVAVFMRLSQKPADREHPFGHSQLESIAALTVGSFVITTAIAIFWDAVSSVYDQITGQVVSSGAAPIALWVALFTVALKILLTIYTQRLGRQTTNPAVVALAYDHRNDIFSASAATIGILLGRMGYPWVDPLAGALVALVILRTGIGILRESATDLMDAVPGDSLDKDVRSILTDFPEVRRVEDIRAHRFGPYLVINLTIGVDGGMSVSQGDRVATKVEQALYRKIDFLRFVHVHFHPAKN